MPDHWNVFRRQETLGSSSYVVLLVQPDIHYVHTEGPIRITEGYT